MDRPDREVTFGIEARDRIKRGVDLIADAVKVTLGPRGRNVVYGFHYGFPVATKDGVTVARQVESSDQGEQLGTLLIRQVAQKTADDAGDGTTTACLLAQSIYSEGLKMVGSGANPILIKRGIDMATADVTKYIDGCKKIISDDDTILNVATLSANNDKVIGKIVASAVKQVGKDGIITIEDDYQKPDITTETIEGMQFNEGMMSPYFMTDQNKGEATYKNPAIMVTSQEINSIQSISAVIEKVIGGAKRPLVIICPKIDNLVMQTLVLNRIKGGLPILCCKAPGFGDYRDNQLEDIAVFVGATLCGHKTGLKPENLNEEHLGSCETLTATKQHTTITQGSGKEETVKARIQQLEFEINMTESDYEKAKFQERLAKLTSGVAVIRVGAPSELEIKERKTRVEDALLATQAAVEEGIVAGGGVTCLFASEFLKNRMMDLALTEEERIGYNIIIKSLRQPIHQIADNAGVEGSEIIAGILKDRGDSNSYGYDFLNNNYGDLIELGVIDPVKVVKSTITNSASVAGIMLTTEVLINETKADEIVRTPKPRSS